MQKLHHLKDLLRKIDPLIAFISAVFGSLVGIKFGTWGMAFPLIGSLLLLLWIRKGGRRGYIVFLIFFSFFFLFTAISSSLPFEGVKTLRGVVISSKNNYYIVSDGFRRVYVYEKDCLKEVGDIISIQGKTYVYEGREYESKFSFASYLQDNGVRYSFYVSEESFLLKMPIRWRELEKNFLSNFSIDSSKIIDMILFGRKDYSSLSISEASYLGLVGIISASGMLYSLSIRLFQKLVFLKFDERKSYLIASVFGILLFPFFMARVGANRVLLNRLMTSYFHLRKKEKPIFPRVSSVGGLILIFLNPFVASNEGFLLGYYFSFFLYFSSSHFKNMKTMKRRVSSFILRSFLFLPYFVVGGEIKLLAPLYSLFFLPFSYLYSVLGYISFLSVSFTRILESLSSFVMSSISFLTKIELSVPLIPIGDELKWAFYLFISLGFYLKEKGLTNIMRGLSAVNLTVFGYLALPIKTVFTKEVVFINVGQGDSILIRDGFHSVLIDTGGNLSFDMARDVLIPFFHKEHVYKLDAVIASHSDFDHIGALDSLLANFHVGEYIYSPESFPYSAGSITLNNHNSFSWSEENDKSLVLSMDFLSRKWLFMGDASVDVEKKIIENEPSLRADIIKIGHHGSKTSSSYSFLEMLKPSTAIISVGKNNSYGHPDDLVLTRLNRLGIEIRRTDLEGSIIYEGWR